MCIVIIIIAIILAIAAVAMFGIDAVLAPIGVIVFIMICSSLFSSKKNTSGSESKEKATATAATDTYIKNVDRKNQHLKEESLNREENSNENHAVKRKCLVCGAEVGENSVYCIECGSKLK